MTAMSTALETQSKRPTIVAVCVALPALSAFVVSLRLYTRLSILRVTGWDDWVIVAALVRATITSLPF